MYICIYVYMYVNIYIYREREKELQKKIHITIWMVHVMFFSFERCHGSELLQAGMERKKYPIVNIFFQMRDPQIEGVQY